MNHFIKQSTFVTQIAIAKLSFSSSMWFFTDQICLSRTTPVRVNGRLLLVPEWLRCRGGKLVPGLGGPGVCCPRKSPGEGLWAPLH